MYPPIPPSESSFMLHQFGVSYVCYLTKHKYANTQALAVQVISWDEETKMWGPHAKVSINCDKEVMLSLGLDEFVFKDYSENEGMLLQFIDIGIVEDTGRTIDLPYAHAPVVRLTSKAAQYFAK